MEDLRGAIGGLVVSELEVESGEYLLGLAEVIKQVLTVAEHGANEAEEVCGELQRLADAHRLPTSTRASVEEVVQYASVVVAFVRRWGSTRTLLQMKHAWRLASSLSACTKNRGPIQAGEWKSNVKKVAKMAAKECTSALLSIFLSPSSAKGGNGVGKSIRLSLFFSLRLAEVAEVFLPAHVEDVDIWRDLLSCWVLAKAGSDEVEKASRDGVKAVEKKLGGCVELIPTQLAASLLSHWGGGEQDEDEWEKERGSDGGGVSVWQRSAYLISALLHLFLSSHSTLDEIKAGLTAMCEWRGALQPWLARSPLLSSLLQEGVVRTAVKGEEEAGMCVQVLSTMSEDERQSIADFASATLRAIFSVVELNPTSDEVELQLDTVWTSMNTSVNIASAMQAHTQIEVVQQVIKEGVEAGTSKLSACLRFSFSLLSSSLSVECQAGIARAIVSSTCAHLRTVLAGGREWYKKGAISDFCTCSVYLAAVVDNEQWVDAIPPSILDRILQLAHLLISAKTEVAQQVWREEEGVIAALSILAVSLPHLEEGGVGGVEDPRSVFDEVHLTNLIEYLQMEVERTSIPAGVEERWKEMAGAKQDRPHFRSVLVPSSPPPSLPPASGGGGGKSVPEAVLDKNATSFLRSVRSLQASDRQVMWERIGMKMNVEEREEVKTIFTYLSSSDVR